MQRAERASGLLALLAATDLAALLELARQGRQGAEPPTFRGRCLDPVYLEAVASGQWTPDDEGLLADLLMRAERLVLPRVPWRARRGLRAAVRGLALSVLTEHLDVPGRSQRAADRGGWLHRAAPSGWPQPSPCGKGQVAYPATGGGASSISL